MILKYWVILDCISGCRSIRTLKNLPLTPVQRLHVIVEWFSGNFVEWFFDNFIDNTLLNLDSYIKGYVNQAKSAPIDTQFRYFSKFPDITTH